MASLLVVDNYDSFVYNLVQQLGALGAECRVLRNDAVSPEDLEGVDGLLVSPGPGRPEDAGASITMVRAASERGVPTLGVCLGHQAIGVAFGGTVSRAGQVVHGKTSRIFHRGEGVFRDLPSPFEATRYHSLAVERDGLPDVLEVSAETEDGTVMGVSHRDAPVQGVQFHPESILTAEGPRLLENFLASLT